MKEPVRTPLRTEAKWLSAAMLWLLLGTGLGLWWFWSEFRKL